MTPSDARGFTLLELVVVLAIASLLFSLGGPSVRTLSATMEYRDAVRQIVSAAKNARRDAFAQGIPMDLLIDTDRNRYALSADSPSLSADQFAALPKARYYCRVRSRGQPEAGASSDSLLPGRWLLGR